MKGSPSTKKMAVSNRPKNLPLSKQAQKRLRNSREAQNVVDEILGSLADRTSKRRKKLKVVISQNRKKRGRWGFTTTAG